MNPDLQLSASEAAVRIRSGRLSAERLVRSCLDRIEERDISIRAWVSLDAARSIEAARWLDRSPPRGPLHGIPVAVKDVILTADFPTQHNSPLFRGFHPRMDAACVGVLRAAGAVILGKTDTVEFAVNGRRALTRNPRDLTRTPGGSSSGSAAAVADHHVPLAIGTQTGGSIIRPASFCGAFAMKPTWGAVSCEGMKACAPTLDTIGWYGRNVADLALLCDAFRIADDAPSRPLPVRLAGARIGVCRSPVWERAAPEARAALERGAEILANAGAAVEPLELPESFAALTNDHKIVMQSEMRATFLAEYAQFGEGLYEELRHQIENRAGLTHAALLRAYDSAARCRAEFDALAAPFDAVLTPSAVGEAPVGLQNTGEAVFNRIWTLLHAPCINVPAFSGPNGMPVGLTLTGPRFGDRRLLSAAEPIADVLMRLGTPVSRLASGPVVDSS